ncbi:MAG: rod shape-determining protein RodA [Clostridia bacterium]|nr:rod shape-determining protein RodA [Clostridia bacterium]MDD4376186.1 rod shape-determining protein RodA [Clostridia bacterium]
MRSLLRNTDMIILIAVLALVIIGIIGIYSAGYNAPELKDDYFKQFIWFIISLIIVVIIWLMDYNWFGILSIPIYIVCIGLLIAVLFTTPIFGATSWFKVGPLSFQPSEITKIILILVSAKYIDFVIQKNKKAMDKWYNVLAVLGIMIGPVLLILKQPDFGTAAVFVFMTAFMLFKAGIKYRYIVMGILIILISIPILYFFVLNEIQKQRIDVFLNPELEPLGSGYNAIQSKIAVGAGMLFGTGLFKGTQTQFGYLPVKTSDFIFSVISEEMGFIISVLIVIIYTILLIRIINVAKTSKDTYGMLVASGIFAMIFCHFVENIGMTMGLLPITGIPLPFVSYGGSNLLTNFISIGIVLSISARRQRTIFVD